MMVRAASPAIPTTWASAADAAKAVIVRQPWVWLTAALFAIVHCATASYYDAQRNELYFLACGWHPDFGYVDQPPLVPLIAAATQIFGVNIWMLRLPATLAAVGLVFLCAALARLCGGGQRAAAIAAIAAGIAPGIAALGSHLTTSTFEPIAWTAAAFLLTRALLQEKRSDLIWLGAVAGAAMEAKWGIAIWLVALGAGVLMTSARRMLTWRELWIGAAIAVGLTMPNLLWQWRHDWPFFEVILPHLESQKNYTGSFWQFEWRQARSMNVVLAPLWLAGVIAPFVDRRLAPVRYIAIGFALTTTFYFLQRGTNYYLFPVYPTMFAVGAVLCERHGVWITRAWMTAAVAMSAVYAPVALPILAPARLQDYMASMRIRPVPIEAAGVGAPLTQSLSDQFGWRELEQQVAKAFRKLSPEEQRRAAIVASNYGQAAAIDVYGRADGLPLALSGHNQYFLWGPRGHDGSLIINIGSNPGRWKPICGAIEMVGMTNTPYAMPYENNRALFICRDLRMPLEELWPRLKRYR